MPVTTVLFWNFNCKTPDKEGIASALALRHNVDVLVLAESMVDSPLLLELLAKGGHPFRMPDTLPEVGKDQRGPKLKIFCKLPTSELTLLTWGGPRLSIWRLNRPGRPELLLAFLHFKSKRSYPGEDPVKGQHQDSTSVYLTIHNAEDKAKHARTIVVGDFNMDPFEDGMIDPERGFGAVMSRELARRHSGRKPLDRVGYRRFYNPMWSLMGRPEAPGTYYWKSKKCVPIYWHTIDQILVRPAAFEWFRDDDIRLLTKAPIAEGGGKGEEVPLIQTPRKHPKIQFSDHLPVLFKVGLSGESHHA